VSDSESDTLSESESNESARQEKALGLANREMTGETVLSVSGENWGAMAVVTRGEDHETDGSKERFWVGRQNANASGLLPLRLKARQG
jgi:hypothetical protein